jgi:gliding motility-associated-like protein
MLRYLFFSLFFLVATSSFATHIVGGEMTYRCLGNNQYEVKMQVFRDCYYGIPWFDSLGSIAAYTSDGNLLFDSLIVPINAFFLVNPDLDTCTLEPYDVCVESATYIDTFTLPMIPGGYYFVYQRCCRNASINNIVDPLTSGATYTIFLTETALNECNTSPVFNQWPPTFICANVPINFDHGATDAEGDEIVYSLCTPLLGATFDDPMPQPPTGPPFNEVIYLSPTYSEFNMLGNPGDPLAIDAQTGLLTGLPTIIGQFVVGVCMNEYRDDILLTTVRRDFQYNVRACSDLIALLDVDSILCDEIVTDIVSLNGNAVTKLFNIYDSDMNLLITQSANFFYAFPDTGSYLVELIINPGEICTDTVTQVVHVTMSPPLGPPIISDPPCIGPNYQVNVIVPPSITENPNIVSYYAQVYYTNNTIVTTNFNDTFSVSINQNGYYTYSVSVVYANGCAGTDTVGHFYNPIINNPPDTIKVCNGDTIYLNAGFIPTGLESDNLYQWSPAPPALSNATVPNPFTIYDPTIAQTFMVTITNSAGCILLDTVHVVPLTEPFQLGLGNANYVPYDTIITCSFPIGLNAFGNYPIASIAWSLSPDMSSPFYFSSSLLTNSVPGNWLYAQATDIYGCESLDSIYIGQITPPNITNVSVSQALCPGQTITVVVSVDSDYPYTLTISPASDLLQINDSTFTMPAQPFNLPISVLAQVTENCTDFMIDTIFGLPDVNFLINAQTEPDTIYLDTIATDDFTQLSTTVINPFQGPVTYNWTPANGLSSTSEANPTAAPDTTTTYLVEITNELGCTATDSVTVWVVTISLDTTVIEPEDTVVVDPNDTLVEPVDTLVTTCDTPFIFLPTGFSPNGDSHNDTWRLYGNQPVDEVVIMVFNRWGDQIFYSEDPDFVWDGTYRGVELPPDAYGYLLSYGCSGDPPKQLKGNVTIIK